MVLCSSGYAKFPLECIFHLFLVVNYCPPLQKAHPRRRQDGNWRSGHLASSSVRPSTLFTSSPTHELQTIYKGLATILTSSATLASIAISIRSTCPSWTEQTGVQYRSTSSHHKKSLFVAGHNQLAAELRKRSSSLLGGQQTTTTKVLPVKITMMSI